MKISILQIFFSFFLTNVNAQHTIEIPEFKNINPKDKYPETSLLAFYANNFDILISLNCYSAWEGDNSIKVLAHNQSGWHKIEFSTGEKVLDLYTVCISTYKINDSIGKAVWDTLSKSHLFDMNDERGSLKEICPPVIIDTIYNNEITEILFQSTSGSDGPEYEFEIITSKDYKKLYFYSPQEKYGYCPKTNELKWIINSITTFEKHLGK